MFASGQKPVNLAAPGVDFQLSAAEPVRLLRL